MQSQALKENDTRLLQIEKDIQRQPGLLQHFVKAQRRIKSKAQVSPSSQEWLCRWLLKGNPDRVLYLFYSQDSEKVIVKSKDTSIRPLVE